MKTKVLYLLILLTSYSFLRMDLYAQGRYNISTYYNYSIRFEKSKFYYPLGLGSTISYKVSTKLFLSSGLEYSHFYEEDQMKITPGVYRTKEIQKESIFSLIAGVSYALFQKKFIVRVGGDIVASRFWYGYDLYRYTVADDQLDTHQKYHNDSNGIGIRIRSDLQYSFSNNIRIFAQPGYTYYLLGEAKKKKMFNTSVGLTFIL